MHLHLRVAIAAAAWFAASTPSAAQIQRLSVSTAGVQANGASDQPAIDHSGRFVAFRSAATNLVAGDSNSVADIFVRDRDTDGDGVFDEPGAVATTRISVTTGGAQADVASEQPAIGADGRFVVFVSAATALATAPDPMPPTNVAQVYRHDRVTGETRLVSVGVLQAAANGDCRSAVVSRDGRYVAFTSAATNLVAADPGFGGGVYLRDMTSGALVRLTEPLPPTTNAPIMPGAIWYQAGTASIDAAGTRVAYTVERHGTYRTFYSITGDVRLYDVAPATAITAIASGHTPQLMADGRSLGFLDATTGGILSTEFRSGGWRHLETGATATLSHDPPLNAKAVAWSPGGRYAAYLTRDPNGVFPGPETRPHEPYLYDRYLDDAWLLPAGTTLGPLDASGRGIVFSAEASTLVAGDTNAAADVFALDLAAFFDADQDGLDDRWEQTVGLSTGSGSGPDGPTGDPDGDGASNADELARGTHPRGSVGRYLAEGATGAFFDTHVALTNPSSAPVTSVVRFSTDAGRQAWRYVRLPAGSRRTADPEAIEGLEGAAFAITVEADGPIVVDRRMSWGAGRYGAHGETSVPAPQSAWFFAEGATGGPFDLFYLLQNAGDATVTADVTYLRPAGGAPIVRSYVLAPRSRTTIHVDDVDPALAVADVSASIAATGPIIAERAMYVSDATTLFRGGHASAGIATLSPSWFFAEGATGAFFDLFLLLANPGTDPVTVTVDYLTDGGTVRTKTYGVAARSRRTVWVDDEDFGTDGKALANAALSMRVTASAPIAAERAMWWPGGGSWQEGHATAGATGTATRWAFADGGMLFAPSIRTYILIANPDTVDATVRVTLLPEAISTTPLVHTLTVPAGSRFTFDVLAATSSFPGDWRTEQRFGALVESLAPASAGIVVERATYWDVGGVVWEAGIGALAVPLP